MDIETICKILIGIINGVGVLIGLIGIWVLSIWIRLKLNKRRINNDKHGKSSWNVRRENWWEV